MNINKPYGSHFNNFSAPALINKDRDLFISPIESAFNDIFNDIFANGGTKLKDRVKEKTNYPKADIYTSEIDDEMFLVFDIAVPGITKDLLEIEFDKDTGQLTVTGESKFEKTVSGFSRQELRHSKFSRSWSVDKTAINHEKTPTSSLENGILNIKIPISLEKETNKNNKKKIPIE